MEVIYIAIVLVFLFFWWIKSKKKYRHQPSKDKSSQLIQQSEQTNIPQNTNKEEGMKTIETITKIILEEGVITEKHYINDKGEQVIKKSKPRNAT